MFQLSSNYQPAGDQPEAIEKIVSWFREQEKKITLLGATGTGKTFTMANVIQQLQKPTLVLSHNKTLAAQLATEFKHFFPNNAVHYFVSYFDYYQPESYLADKGLYIEKEATINKEIEMYRLSTMASLLSRDDVIVVSSVSALYGLGSREFFANNRLFVECGKEYSLDEIKEQLIRMQYKPVHGTIEAGMFALHGEMLDIYASTDKHLRRLYFNDTTLEYIQLRDPLTFAPIDTVERCTVRPATQFLQNLDNLTDILKNIEQEMVERVKWFTENGMIVEAQRLQKRVMYDIKMIQETWFVNGIENYSPYFEQRLDNAPPNTIFDYFPDDFLLIIDESHMTIPQFQGMPQADKSRKTALVDYGFRLPSAIAHRPLWFNELTTKLQRTWRNESIHTTLRTSTKQAKTLFVSATPAQYELDMSTKIVQQIIRPTWLLDPIAYVYPKSGSYDLLYASIDRVCKKDPVVVPLLQWYDEHLQKNHHLFG
jgi:excinuclease ABC subunit B